MRVKADWAGSEDAGRISTEMLMELYHAITGRIKFRWPPPRSIFPVLPPVLVDLRDVVLVECLMLNDCAHLAIPRANVLVMH